jgi:dephospho-CoA kinase
MDRDGVSELEVVSRMRSQIDYEKKMQSWANDKKIHILQNNGGVDDLKFAIQKIIKEIT